MENIAQIIKELRSFGLKQTEIANELQVSQGYVSTIEAGKRGSRTPAETLERAKNARDRLRAQHS